MQSIPKKYELPSVAIIFILLLCTSSCINLTAVREWSTASLEAAQYNGIVTNYVNTPERLKRYDPSGPWDEQIKLRKNQAEALKEILSVVSDYMAALSILSADSTIDYSKNMESLTNGIDKLNAGISKETTGAIGSIVKTVLGASAKAYQAKQTAIIIENGNAPLQIILHSELRDIVDKDFRRDLKIEGITIDHYYDSLYQTEKTSKAAKAAIVEWKELRLEENTKRMRAIDAYLKILDNISEGHEKLYMNRKKLDAKILIKDLYALSVDLKKQIKILAGS